MAFINGAGVSHLWHNHILPALKGKQDNLTFDDEPRYDSSNPVKSSGIRTAIDKATDCFFYVQIKLGASGFELDGTTYADIINAYTAGKRIVGKAYVPSEAGLGFSGKFDIPMTYFNDSFVLSFITGCENCEVFIGSDNSVAVIIRNLQNSQSRVTSISKDSTDEQYPTAKAVYDFIESRLNGLTFMQASDEPTTDDPNTITFVNKE